MNILFKGNNSARGTLEAPPSKSFAHRILIMSALSGEGSIFPVSYSKDMDATIGCLTGLGYRLARNGNVIEVNGFEKKENPVLDCLESGSTLRFMIPVSLLSSEKVTFIGTQRLMERGITVYEDLFEKKGIKVIKGATSVEICGRLLPGEYVVPGNISSQYISGLLMALPFLDGDSILKIDKTTESRPYIDITLEVLRLFGVNVSEKKEGVFIIPGNQTIKKGDYHVEGDWSNAAALLAYNYRGITEDAVSVSGLNNDSRQGDRCATEYLRKLCEGRPTLDISDCPDLGPVLFAVAALNHGAEFTGIGRLRIKESDRALAMATELAKCGVSCETTDNTMTIYGSTPKCSIKAPTENISSWNDHRIVMAMSLILSVTGGVIDGAESINKSYPDYFERIREIGIEVECDE